MRSPAEIVLAAAIVLGSPAYGFAAPEVNAEASAGATSLTLDGMGSASTRIVKVADISLFTHATGGLTLTITSAGLTKADGSTPILFQVVLVDNNAAAPSSAAFTTPSATQYTFSTTAAGVVEKDLYIKYLARSLQDPGVYTASIDLDAVDN